MRVINFIGAPGSGKSTTAARTYHALSSRGKSVELVTEAAKDVVWDGLDTRDWQVQLLGEQYRRLKRLEGQVDIAVSDAPLPLFAAYAARFGYPQSLATLALDLFGEFENVTYLLKTDLPYSPAGRLQREATVARALEKLIERVPLVEWTVVYDPEDAVSWAVKEALTW